MEIGARSSESFITTLSSYIICRSQSCSAKWVWMAGTQLWLLCSWLASHRCTRRPGEHEGTFQTAVSNYSFCPCLSTYLPAILISHFPWLIATAISSLPPHKRRRKWSFHSTLWHLWQISFFRVKAAWELFYSYLQQPHGLGGLLSTCCIWEWSFMLPLYLEVTQGSAEPIFHIPMSLCCFFLSHIYTEAFRFTLQEKEANARRK